jgi:hypothetical protein
MKKKEKFGYFVIYMGILRKIILFFMAAILQQMEDFLVGLLLDYYQEL